MRIPTLTHLALLLGGALSFATAAEPAPPTVTIAAAQARTLFGGKPAKLVVTYQPAKKIAWRDLSEGEEIIETSVPLHLIDLSANPPSSVLLTADAKANLGDPFISPDGTRFAYHTEEGIRVARCAAGAPGSTLIATDGFDQRWWIHPTTGDEYLIYASTRASNASSMEGRTLLQKLKKGGCEAEGAPTVLIEGSAYRGGRSPDGAYICSTQPGLAQALLSVPTAVEKAELKVLFTSSRKCNSSMSQDPARPALFLWEDTSHTVIFYDPADHAKTIPVPPGYKHQQWCEWSTHPDYLTASPSQTDDIADHKLHDIHVYQWSTKTWTKLTTGGGPTHLWVGK